MVKRFVSLHGSYLGAKKCFKMLLNQSLDRHRCVKRGEVGVQQVSLIIFLINPKNRVAPLEFSNTPNQ